MEDVLRDIERAGEALRTAPWRNIYTGISACEYHHFGAEVSCPDCQVWVGVADLGDTTVPEAPEAACRFAIPFLATVTEKGGRRKQVLQAAPPEVVEAWMAEYPGSYGDPARGFAGRYI